MLTITELQLMFIGLSLFIIILEIPLAMNRIKPNRLYGFRVRKTLTDERVWYLVNAYSAKWSIVAGTLTILCAIALRLVPLPLLSYEFAVALIFAGSFMLTIVMTLIYMSRIS